MITPGLGEAPRVDAALLREEIRAGRTVLRSPPSTINIELTGRCNVKPPCLFCRGKWVPGYREPPDLSTEQLDRYWAYLLRARVVNDCSFGEPLLHPGFRSITARLVEAGVKFGFTTNGLLLDDEHARFLAVRAHCVNFIVSVDAGRAETYRWLHGRELGPLLRNLETFLCLHRRAHPGEAPPMVLSYIVLRSNQEEIPEFLDLAEGIGVRHVMLRHLFDGAGPDSCERLGRVYRHQDERLPFQEYRQIERRVRAQASSGLSIEFAWNEKDSFLAQQAEEGIGFPCYFPWKFLSLRPVHGWCSPCPFLEATGLAALPAASVESFWNGRVTARMRASLARGRIPRVCMRSGGCPLVLARRSAPRRIEQIAAKVRGWMRGRGSSAP